jgi:YD repeat-containing protein
MTKITRLVGLACALLAVLAQYSTAQDQNSEARGIVPTGSFQRYKVDTVNLGNGNVIVTIPLFSLPQLGNLSLSFSAVANTSMWEAMQDCSDDLATCTYWYRQVQPQTLYSPEQDSFGGPGPTIVMNQGYEAASLRNIYESGAATLAVMDWSVTDATSAKHPLFYDASNHAQLRTVDGSKLLFLPGTSAPYGSTQAPANATTVVDSRGTYYTYYADTQTFRFTDTSNNSIVASRDPNTSQISIQDSVLRTLPDTVPTTTAGCPDLSTQGNFQPVVSSRLWTVPGSNGTATYQFCYTHFVSRSNFWNNGGKTVNTSNSIGGCGDPGMPACNMSQTYLEASGGLYALQSIVLPDKTFWGFIYDAANPDDSNDIQYGTLRKIILPTGGTIEYEYQNEFACYWSDQGIAAAVGAPNHWDSRHLIARTETDAAGHSYRWKYTINGYPEFAEARQKVTVTDPNLNDTVYSFTTPPGVSNNLCNYTEESNRKIYQGSSGTGQLLKSIDTTYQYASLPQNNRIPEDGVANALPLSSTTTLDSDSATTTTTSTSYDDTVTNLFQAVYIYCFHAVVVDPSTCPVGPPTDIALGIPVSQSITNASATPLRTTETSFAWQTAYGSRAPEYRNANLLDTPYVVSLYNGPSDDAHRASKTTTTYDESSSTRGLPTAVTKWNNNGDDVVTHTVWNDNGTIDHTLDGRQNQDAKYIYDSQYSGLYPTTIRNAIGQDSHYGYDFNTGKVTSVTDVNQQITSYAYDANQRLTGTTLTCAGSRSCGGTQYCYNLIGTSGSINSPTGCSNPISNSVVTSTSMTASSSISRETDVDGLGRVIHTRLLSDPAGTDTVDISYDGLDQIVTRSNPHRELADTDTSGTTSFEYDALGRMRKQYQPDNIPSEGNPGTSYLEWQYAGHQTDVYDELRNHKQLFSDPLGRLVTVLEPDPQTNNPSLETDYQYNGLDLLIQVDQWGGAKNSVGNRSRTFSYDSLGRLLIAKNAESGKTCYGKWNGEYCQLGYDGNSNLKFKTDARGTITSYSYDNLNRLTGKTYSSGSAATTLSSCFAYDTATNGVGLLATEWTQAGACPSSPPTNPQTLRAIQEYKEWGRIKQERQCHLDKCAAPVTVSMDYDEVGNLTSYSNGLGSIQLSPTYDPAGRLQYINSSLYGPQFPSYPATLLSVEKYSPAGGIANMKFGPVIDVVRQYDNRLRPTGQSVTHP